MTQGPESRDGEFVLTAEASRILHKSSETVRAWERRGILKAIKTSRGVRLFRRDEIERVAREQQSNADGRVAS